MTPLTYTLPDPREGYVHSKWTIAAKKDYRRNLWNGVAGWRGSTFIPYDGKTPTFTAQPRVFR